jgi:prefoldin beta subunit
MTDKKNTNMINTYKQQLMYISQQKQQIQFQVNILDSTIKELENTKEKKVYKGVGNVFVLSDKENVLKQTKDSKETVELKLKNLEKQESEFIKKLNELSKSNDNKNDKKTEQNVEGVA